MERLAKFWLMSLLNKIVRAVTCNQCGSAMEWPCDNTGTCYGEWCPNCKR
jgi:hypothetical protein